MKKFLAFFLLLAPSILAAQGVAVAPLTLPRQQFFSPTGVPLAAGCVTFTAAGTSTPQAIYSDYTGLYQLANPLTLDAGGMTSVWMTNTAYRITMYTGVTGQLCSAFLGTQLWVQDFVNPFSIINQGSNFVVASSTSDPSGVPGELGYRSDIPCLRIFTSIWDCVVTLTATQSLSNKTIIAPVITSGGSWSGSPTLTTAVINGIDTQVGVTYTFAATDEQKLVTLNNASPVAVTLPQASTTGFGAGTSFHVRNLGAGIVTITPTTSTIDLAATLVLLTGQGADIYSDGINYSTQKGSAPLSGGAAAGCTNFTPVTITNLNTQQNLLSCTLALNSLVQGSMLEVDVTGLESTAGAGQNITLTAAVGGGTSCTVVLSAGIANNQPWNFVGKFSVLTTGAGGTGNWSCEGFLPNSVVGPFGVVGTPTIAVNTTVTNTLQITVQMQTASASNTTIGQLLKAVIF
jgi:hypothetical protein